MNVYGVRVSRARCPCQIQRMTDGTSVIGAVIDDVEEHFLSRQGSMLPIDELKLDCLSEFDLRSFRDILFEPQVRGD